MILANISWRYLTRLKDIILRLMMSFTLGSVLATETLAFICDDKGRVAPLLCYIKLKDYAARGNSLTPDVGKKVFNEVFEEQFALRRGISFFGR